MPGVQFVDLQYGDTEEARDELHRLHGLEIAHFDDVDLHDDLEGLAALCNACDLVITVSNVTAHMAGALGRPVWLLLPMPGAAVYWFSGGKKPVLSSMRLSRAGLWRLAGRAGHVARDLAACVGADADLGDRRHGRGHASLGILLDLLEWRRDSSVSPNCLKTPWPTPTNTQNGTITWAGPLSCTSTEWGEPRPRQEIPAQDLSRPGAQSSPGRVQKLLTP